MTKEERRRSKDDAWVDILFASHSRRTGNQDAELRRPGGPRSRSASRHNPEVASQEVAQVLAGIRGPSLPFDGERVDIEPRNVPHRSRMDSIGTALDEIYAPTIPGSVGRHSSPSTAAPSTVDGLFRLASRILAHSSGRGWRRHVRRIRPGSRRYCMETPPRRSDTTESVYSSGPTPPASPKPSPDLILNGFISTPPLAPSPPLPLCRPQCRAHRHRYILNVTCNDSRRCATDCQDSPGRRRAR